MTPDDGKPQFAVLEYISIARDPRTQLVVAIGGDERAAGILQTTGQFISHPGPRGPYHRQPHALPVEQQRQGATAAAHALLLAGFSVHLDPTLNILTTPGGDQQAAHRYLEHLMERADAADKDRSVADILTELCAPSGLLPGIDRALRSTWFSWGERLRDSGQDPAPAERLMQITTSLAQHTRQIEQLRNTAATRPVTSPPQPPAVPPARRR
ncbi:hypothetical protein [Streptomyces sp. NBC_00690]|uniref:hypothetical protein n=1 Tax=Streptomyces sp. NBC_00690 TaxID=2975808 RepID=UPI002E28DBF5|nr:hypothetical protein [Streptomyces sp. NBC_00690]